MTRHASTHAKGITARPARSGDGAGRQRRPPERALLTSVLALVAEVEALDAALADHERRHWFGEEVGPRPGRRATPRRPAGPPVARGRRAPAPTPPSRA